MVSSTTASATTDDSLVPISATVPTPDEPQQPVAGGRKLTAAEEAEVKRLSELKSQLEAKISGPGGLQDSRKTWEGILAGPNAALATLKALQAQAEAKLKAATDALDKFDEQFGKGVGTIAERDVLVTAKQKAADYLKGVQDSVAAVQGLLKNIQERIDFINGYINYYNAYIKLIVQRVGDIYSAALANQPSGPAPDFKPEPVPVLPPESGDWTKPFPWPKQTTPPKTGDKDSPDESEDPEAAMFVLTPVQYEIDPLAPIVV